MKETIAISDSLCPSIRVALNGSLPVTFMLKQRAIFDYELMYIGSGSVCVVIEEDTHIARKGDFVLFKPGVEHSCTLIADPNDTSSPPQVHLPHIHFDLLPRPSHHKVYTSFKPLCDFDANEFDMISPDITGENGLNIPPHIRLKDSQPSKNLLLRIISEKVIQTQGGNLTANGLLLELLGIIKTSLDVSESQQVELNMHRLEKVYKYIKNNLALSLNIEELAHIAGLSKYYMTKLFKEAFGEPPIATQRRLRVERACELLLYTDMPVTHIAEEVGFEAVHSLSRVFRKLNGASPLQYRASRKGPK